MTLLLREGLKGLKKVETYGVLGVILIVLGIFFWFLPDVNYENLNYINNENFFFPLGVTLFALLGFSAIPELRREIKGDEKLLKKAIIAGAFIAIFVYLIFVLSFVGVFGKSVLEIATLSSGRIVALLGVFTMLTSYFVLSFALRDMFIFDFNIAKHKAFFYVSIVPLVVFLIVSYFNLASFVFVLGIGGVVSGGLTGVTGLVMSMKAKQRRGKQGRKPEYKMPLNWWIVGVLSLVFVIGVVVEVLM